MDDYSPDDDALEASRAPFLEHLEELRRRLWHSILGLLITCAVCWIFRAELFQIVTEPLSEILTGNDRDAAMKFRTVGGAFMFQFKTTILGGVFLAMPLILFQIWQFVAPGLYNNEKRFALPFMFIASLCFYAGIWFAYSLALPITFDFLMGFEVNLGDFRLEPDITSEDYFGLFTQGLLVFGLLFELPVIFGFLSAAGVVDYRDLLQFWRWSIVIAFVLGALIAT